MSKILLVDDVDLFLELERSYLEDCGYDLITASSGEEALQRLDKVAPNVLLLDYYMPGINGDEVCRLIRKNPQWEKLPILMVTAAGKPEEVQHCLDAGCDDYITKPVNKQELREKVARLLGQLQRRTSERIAVTLPLQLQEGGRLHVVTAKDISSSGIRLKSPTPLEENTTVEMKLEDADGDPLSLYGRIKRTTNRSEDGYGVYFIYPDQKSKQLLDRLIRSKKAEQLEAEGIDDRLSQRLQTLENECSKLRAEQDDALRRIGELEQENLDFANQLVQVEDVNNNLTNLYIASSRLHSTLDREETLGIIKEVVINFVGAEKFAVFLFDKTTEELHFETGEGFDGSESFPDIPLGEGVLGKIAADEENYFCQGSITEGSDDLQAPIVAIPLIIDGKMIGLLAIYRLFIQKEQLESIDYQLFSMLGEHAASALFSSTLYGHSERKRQTYQGFVDLLLK
ncbi:Response regulators consisting of a CheY-like receiver domain and a winged-helix DNA-binding domain [Desulfuromusa kysingii]|uniref:Response regulators consisting of a CheY-like receiver domain and a winged-helix DNA-binding domain n=1 Tax=Desulfuromusa kysingii TaxID=37625 RepID=A0A1H4DYH2_9BACT|nr:response regulator [Desulfuromusa kysingii]SEA77834.1 Response regulators consisting of a CheY-like receiver domain and a winged-helix DNA-binding domain [Desulfuromusa kysingii]